MNMVHSIETDVSNFEITVTIMEKEMNVTLEGVKLEIHKIERPELKGIYAKVSLNFDFYAAEYKSCEFLLLEPTNNECSRYTLAQFSDISKIISDIFGKPVVYLFDNRIYYDENRMPNARGVYFICSDEYAFLPFLPK